MTDKMSEHRSQSTTTLRRINKPLMEKKRRARINSCLGQLKSLVLEAMKKDPSRYSKLEKADILEMTVKHLRDVQRQSLSVAASADPTVVPKYRTGYNECAKEVTRYLSSVDGVAPEVRMRVLQHLNGCVGHMANSGMGLPRAAHVPMQPISVHIPGATTMTSLPGAPRLMTQSPTPLQTVMTPEGTQIQGTFQLLPGPYPGGNGITVFIPSPRGSQGSSARSSPSSSMSDISPASSPEPTPRPLTVAEKKQGVSPAFSYGGSGPFAPREAPVRVSVARDINHNEIAVCKEERVWRPW